MGTRISKELNMAIELVFTGQGVSAAQYEQVLNEVCPGDVMPDGMLYHVAAPTEDGWMVVEVWESQEKVDRFFQEKLGQALQKANINIQPKILQVHKLLKR